MKLKKLTIELGRSYESHAGQYKSEIEYEDANGAIQMLLDPQISNALLLCIGETIAAFAAKASQQLEQSIVKSVEEAKGKVIEEQKA